MAQGHKFQDLEETGEVLVAFINSSQLEKLKRVKDEHQALFNQHVETKKIVRQILKGNRTFSDLLLLISLCSRSSFCSFIVSIMDLLPQMWLRSRRQPARGCSTWRRRRSRERTSCRMWRNICGSARPRARWPTLNYSILFYLYSVLSRAVVILFFVSVL